MLLKSATFSKMKYLLENSGIPDLKLIKYLLAYAFIHLIITVLFTATCLMICCVHQYRILWREIPFSKLSNWKVHLKINLVHTMRYALKYLLYTFHSINQGEKHGQKISFWIHNVTAYSSRRANFGKFVSRQ